MSQLDNHTFVCLDCETTGLDPDKDRVIEVAVMVFTTEKEIHVFDTLINPECQIPEESIKIHNITQEMVCNMPTIDQVLPEILKIIGKHPIVGHGVKFDITLLANACERAGIMHGLNSNKVIDTLRMARMYGESPINSLKQLGKHFNIQEEGAHRAMSDVVVNVEVFKYLLKQFKNLKHLYEALEKPVMMKTMPLGKHKGRLIKDLPLDYLMWAASKDFDQDLLFSLRSEIKRRKKGNLFTQSNNPFSNL